MKTSPVVFMPPDSSTWGSPSPSSRQLLARAAQGDRSAVGRLLGRCLPDLQRWAHRRLPAWARTAADTADLVQDAVLGTLRRLDRFDFRGRETLAAYLRAAVRNHIRDEHRRFNRRGAHQTIPTALADPGASPHERAVSGELRSQYRAALARLRPLDRELVVAHVELEYTHDQLAFMTGRSRNAARMALRRAIHRLVRHMREG